MGKLIFVALIATFLFSQPVLATEAISSASLTTVKIDNRPEILRRFLNSFNSPLTPYAVNFIRTADKYQLDWKLIPAITGVESTFGKFIPAGSYNAYGWANGAYYFKSWEDSIEIVAKTLRENYYNRGAETVEEIAPIYAPPSNTWAWKVRFFMEKLANFVPKSTIALELSL